MEWYQKLDINHKIALKEITPLICGIKWETLGMLFSYKERIEILHNKLVIEGLVK